MEAKGGSSDVGSKEVGGCKRAEQGTKEYLQKTVEEMKARGGEDAQIARKIEVAMRYENLEYYKISQKLNPDGTLKPAELKKFDLQ